MKQRPTGNSMQEITIFKRRIISSLRYLSKQMFKKLPNSQTLLVNSSHKKIILFLFLLAFNLANFCPLQANNTAANRTSAIIQNQDLIIKNSHFVYSIAVFLILSITVVTILIILNKKLIKLKKELINKNVIISNEKMISENFHASINKTLEERELLLKEIHHRVKNNLQIIMSLLRVEAKEGTKVNDINYFIEKSQTRILSIALVHQNLYENENLKNIDYNSYIYDMCKNLDSILNVSHKKIQFTISADAIFFDLETASTLGLILNELISNSYKHAFANENEGKIKITIVKNFEKEFKLTYGDNGLGLPTDKTTTHKSLGLELIELWTKQLNGKLTRKKTTKGLAYQIVFTTTT